MAQRCQGMVHAHASLKLVLVVMFVSLFSSKQALADEERLLRRSGFTEGRRRGNGLPLASGHTGVKDDSSGANVDDRGLQQAAELVPYNSRGFRRALGEGLPRDLLDVDQIWLRYIPRLRRIPASPPQKHYKVEPAPGDPPLRDISLLDQPSPFP